MMKLCNKCKELKPLDQFDKNVGGKYGLRSHCRECRLEYNRKFNRENIEWRRSYRLAYNKLHETEIKEWQKNYRKENREAINKKISLLTKANREGANARHAKQRAAQLNATPKWLTKEQIEQIKEWYLYAKIFTETKGIKHEVDHIVPLQGKNVCGLHVPWNLQILTREENRSKGNKV